MQWAWRIIKSKLSNHAFDGEGSRIYEGRWTSPGLPVIYTSESLSLATLEVLVHIQSSAPLGAYLQYKIGFTDELVEDLNQEKPPGNWRDSPAPVELRAFGDSWIRSGTSVLFRVPSTIITHEFNFLINPLHDDFTKLRLEDPRPLDIDSRVFQN